MSRWRVAVVVVLVALPTVFLMVLGSYHLWQLGLGFYVWWPLTACMSIGYLLARYWLRQKRLLHPVDFNAPLHWTDRDREAWKLVEARAKTFAGLEMTQLNEFQFYVDASQEMALELARFYHPDAKDPLGSLTVPEVLAVIELASHDLAAMVEQNVPGSHLMTINDWRWAKKTAEQATTWYKTASNVYWLASAVLSPIETGLRYAASKVSTGKPLQLFQQDLVSWFHTAFIHRVGTYLIDLNSGRLRVGATRYRQIKQTLEAPDGTAAPDGVVTLTVMGQVKMGKSSFINALLGEQRARADVLPATANVTRYQLQLPETQTSLVVLDTVGYAHTGPKEDQLQATEEAAQTSDLLILVVHARNPARQADLKMLQELKQWFAERPDLKMPPVLAVMTHIDLLSPAMEWAPPYNWQEPQRPKEIQIQEALAALQEQLGESLIGAVPVCTAESKVYGIEEGLLPRLAELLGEAKAVAALRCLRAEVDTSKVHKVFVQLLTVGEQAAQLWLSRRQAKKP